MKSRISFFKGLFRRLIRHEDGLFYAVSNTTQQAAMLAAQIIILRFIPPEEMGIWQTMLVISAYLSMTQFGVVNAMNLEYPYLLGRGEKERALAVIQTAQIYNLANASLVFLVYAVLGLISMARSPQNWTLAFLAMAFVAGSNTHITYLECTYRAGSEFRRLAKLRLMMIPVYLGLLILPYRLGFRGLLLREAIIWGIMLLSWHIGRPVRIKPRWVPDSFRALISTGWRLWLSSYAVQMARAVPRLALVVLSGTLAVGLYSPINWIVTAFYSISESIGAYLYPTLIFRYARDGIAVSKTTMKATLLVIGMLAPLVFIGELTLPWLIRSFIPKYVAAAGASRVALLAGFLECFSIACMCFAIVKKWRLLLIYSVCMLASKVTCIFTGVWLFHDDLLGVSVGMLLSSIILIPIIVAIVRKAGESLPAMETLPRSVL